MCGFVRALVFIYILFICVDSAPYFLDPPFPPLAIIGQSYELKFQVRGLPQLAFTFQGLPSFFTGSQDGSIKGTPLETGSYKVAVTYTSKNTTGSEQVIISIATNQTDLNSDIVLKMNTLQIETSASSWIYRAGQSIQIEFWCSDAQEPIAMGFRNLPQGITADLTVISGSIATPGLYTFSVFLGDAGGNQAQTYYTLNIQPKISLTTQSSKKFADVSVVTQSSNINLSKVDSDRIKTHNKVQSLYVKLQSILTAYNMAKNTQIIAYNNMLLAQQQSLTFDQSFTSAQSNYNKILSFIKEATTVIQNLKMQVSIGVKSTNQSNAEVMQAEQNYKNSISVSQNLTSKYNSSSELYASTQRELSEIKKQVNVKLAESISARNNYTLAVNNQEKAKIDLDNAKSESSFASDQAGKGQIFRELSMQDRDAAENNLKTADATVKDAKNQLNSSTINLNQIRIDFSSAKKQLGAAKFNLTMAENSLFVAQAAKQASDKSLAIIVAQGIGNTVKSNYNFSGCVQNGRPTLFGTAKIIKLGTNTVNTSAGHTLIWGQCTKKVSLSVGSYIYYEGFIAQDSISVKLIKTVTF